MGGVGEGFGECIGLVHGRTSTNGHLSATVRFLLLDRAPIHTLLLKPPYYKELQRPHLNNGQVWNLPTATSLHGQVNYVLMAVI